MIPNFICLLVRFSPGTQVNFLSPLSIFSLFFLLPLLKALIQQFRFIPPTPSLYCFSNPLASQVGLGTRQGLLCRRVQKSDLERSQGVWTKLAEEGGHLLYHFPGLSYGLASGVSKSFWCLGRSAIVLNSSKKIHKNKHMPK